MVFGLLKKKLNLRKLLTFTVNSRSKRSLITSVLEVKDKCANSFNIIRLVAKMLMKYSKLSVKNTTKKGFGLKKKTQDYKMAF